MICYTTIHDEKCRSFRLEDVAWKGTGSAAIANFPGEPRTIQSSHVSKIARMLGEHEVAHDYLYSIPFSNGIYGL